MNEMRKQTAMGPTTAAAPPDTGSYVALEMDDFDSVFVEDLLAFLDTPLHSTPSPLQTPSSVGNYDDQHAAQIDDATFVDSRSDCSSHSPRPLASAAPLSVRNPGSSFVFRSTKKGGSQLKRHLDATRAEMHHLAEELQRLRQGDYDTSSAAMESAQNERFKRRRAERECQQLRDAVYAQTLFIRGLKSVFSMPPSFAAGLNLCHHLHNYTRLPRDRSTRWNEYVTLAPETRLKNAMDILCRETESLSVSDDDEPDEAVSPSRISPFIQTEMLPDRNGFSVTTTSVFAMESCDLGAMLRGVCVASCDIMSACPSYPATDIQRTIVDPDAPPPSPPTSSPTSPPSFLYRAMDVHYKSLDAHGDELQIESRAITLCKQTHDYAVVVWDYVDDDELHPTSVDADITRQAIGACLIRQELCSDGVERTVYRSLATRRYRYHERAPRDVLERYYHDSIARMRTNESLFHDIMLQEIATEQELYAQAVRRLNTTK